MNYVLAIVVAAATVLVVWWVSKWKWPTPATVKCKIKSVQKQKGGFSLQLQVEEVIMAPPSDIFQKWARPYLEGRLPKAGQGHTFWVPEEKMRAELREGEMVAITGRLLQPVGGGTAEFSIWGAEPIVDK